MFTPNDTIQEAVEMVRRQGFGRVTVTIKGTGEAVTICDAETWKKISQLIEDAEL